MDRVCVCDVCVGVSVVMVMYVMYKMDADVELYVYVACVQKYRRVAVKRDSVPVIDVNTVSHIRCSSVSKWVYAKLSHASLLKRPRQV